MASWEEMAVEVLAQGRPGDVQSAALGWQQLLNGFDEVKRSLNDNVDDLAGRWKGPAFEAFKKHIKAIADQLDQLETNAKKGDGIVASLQHAAEKLATAQHDMPIPAAVIGDIMQARNASLNIGPGFFKLRLTSDFYSWDPVRWEGKLMDFLDNHEDEARTVYDRVGGQYQDQSGRTPGDPDAMPRVQTSPTVPNLTTGNPGGRTGGVPGLGGAPHVGGGSMPGTGSGFTDPGLGSDPYAGTDPYSTGLSGSAGGPGITGVGAGPGGLGGLGGPTGLGSGSGHLPGGGALGRGVGGMPGGMLGGMGGVGGGRGGASGRGGAAGRGAGGRGGSMLGGGGHGGAGAGGDERTTWLQEEDDPWGADNDAPPSVLK